METKQICLGHIAPKNERCKKCIADYKNKGCKDFEPIRLEIFEVEDFPFDREYVGVMGE